MEASKNWRLVEEIFTDAVSLPAAQQRPFVEARCENDPAIRDQVLELLSAHRDMGGFLQSSVFDLRGHQFGPYRAIEEAGRGGMSVVYKGERIDGSFDKPVAIKVVFADAALLPETRILASVEHPNVARLLDAGVTGMGLRYLVMEFVEGVPCSEWARARSVEEKLRMFLQICAGVQAAHRALIVHRDLKPENVLVTSGGIAKLLDFGIAKQLAPTGTQTAGMRAYTPDYASPEQILGHPASTSNDIYSLGVILCEMLTGSRPRRLTGLPLDEVLREIEHGEIEPSIDGDPGHIVRKSIHADPTQRYQTAGDLARDVENFLAQRPVSARPDSWSYRARRFLGRNRWPVAAATVAILATGAATATALWQARLASQRFEIVRKLSNSVLFELHDAVERLPGSLQARELLVKRSIDYLDGLSNTAGSNTDLQIEIARGYMRLSMITGNSYKDLGRAKDALAYAKRAEMIMRQVISRRPNDLEARRQFASALDTLQNFHERNGDLERAAGPLREMIATVQETIRLFPNDFHARMDSARIHHLQAEHASTRGQREKVAEEYRTAVAGYRSALELRPDDLDAQVDTSRSLFALAKWHDDARELEPARKYAAEALALAKKAAAGGIAHAPQAVMAVTNQLANIARAEGKFDESTRLFQEQLPFARAAVKADPDASSPKQDLGILFYYICGNFMSQKRWDDARSNCDESVNYLRQAYRAQPDRITFTRFLMFGLSRAADLHGRKKDTARACALAKEGAALFEPMAKVAETAGEKRVKEAIRKRIAGCGQS